MTNTIECPSSTAAKSDARAHIISPSKLIGALAGLLVLTLITVAGTYIDMGSIVNVWFAFGIAVVQAAVVALYFMHLRWVNSFNGLVLIVAVFFAALFVGMAVLGRGKQNRFFRTLDEIPSLTLARFGQLK